MTLMAHQGVRSRPARAGVASQSARRSQPSSGRTPFIPHRPVQFRPAVTGPSDPCEQEAERIAGAITAVSYAGPSRPTGSLVDVQMGLPPTPHRCLECDEDQAESGHQFHADRNGGRMEASHALAPSLDPVVRDGGAPLDRAALLYFESRLGHDFSQVRVHTDVRADESARQVGARAYTTGSDVVFASGQYSTETPGGRRLLAHELVHVAQQREGTGGEPRIRRTIGDGHDLQAPRLAGNLQLEAAFDNELLIRKGMRGEAVRRIQDSLLQQGYTFPGFGVDGIFGSETQAVVRQFQRETGASVDGIVGPETMTQLDLHDTSLLAGPGPVAAQGPRPGPRPGAGCSAPYRGVTFTLAHAGGAGVAPAAQIRAVRVGGRDALQMRGVAPASYTPDVTINAPDDPTARRFEVGFASNLLTETVEYRFSTGVQLRSTLPTPIKDGRALASGQYDPVYVETAAAGVHETFAANADTRSLAWPDVPSEFAFINISDNAECFGPLAPGTMTDALFHDFFRTWVAVRHTPSGCVRALHHIDWALDWRATIAPGAAGGLPAVNTVSDVINVTEPNGDGRPPFIQGGRVPDDLLAANRVCN